MQISDLNRFSSDIEFDSFLHPHCSPGVAVALTAGVMYSILGDFVVMVRGAMVARVNHNLYESPASTG